MAADGARTNDSKNSTPSWALRSSRRHRRRSGSSSPLAATSAVLVLLGLLTNLRNANAQFGYGDPIDVVVTAGDTLTLTFEGDVASAVGISFQQCTGDVYMEVDLSFNGTSLVSTSDTETSKCLTVTGTLADGDDYDNLCAFQNSGPVGQGYFTESALLSSPNVNPNLIAAEFTNNGDITASAQVVIFSAEDPAPSSDEAIDRVVTNYFQEGNTFTIAAEFQADGGEDENFCSGSAGCSVHAYYLEIDDTDPDADNIFGTVCQARGGVLLYEGFTGAGSTFEDESESEDDELTTEDTATETDVDTTAEEVTNDDVEVQDGSARRFLSTTSFDITACVEFPKNTAGVYRMYIVVSPDTASYSRVGYGLQDQLMYASGLIAVEEDDSNYVCPEIVEDEESSGAAGSAKTQPTVVLTATRASAAMAAGLAAAAAATRGGL